MALKHPNVHDDHQNYRMLDTKSYHEANFVIAGCTGSYHKSSLRAASDRFSAK